MSKNNKQAPNAVVMVRPHHFTPNPQTAGDNMFQVSVKGAEKTVIAQQAYSQVTHAANTLQEQGVTVHLFDDKTTQTPDSVFPNNWFSTHSDGTIVTYPMYAENRRLERRHDIIKALQALYNVKHTVDYSAYENDGVYLEGTGAMVLDHEARIAYAVRSQRAHTMLLNQFCEDLGYQPLMFDASDASGTPIYHTNVMMCVASDFAIIGLDMIKTDDERNLVLNKLKSSDHKIITLNSWQINAFAGNALELQADSGKILALSQSALNVLEREQIKLIEETARIVSIDVSAVEMAGGSLRCMLAGIHLDSR